MDNVVETHITKSFTLFNALGHLGGVIEIFIFVFSFIVCPFSHHSYKLKALEKLFLARTHDNEFAKSRFVYGNHDKKYIKVKKGQVNLAKKHHLPDDLINSDI